MKRLLLTILAITVCFVAFSGCGKQNTGLLPFEPPTSEGVLSVNVLSSPEGYHYSFTGEDAKKVVEYFAEIELTTNYDDKPNEMTGMTWVISIAYGDGNIETLYELSPFIRTEEGVYYKVIQASGSGFDTLLVELANEEGSPLD